MPNPMIKERKSATKAATKIVVMAIPSNSAASLALSEIGKFTAFLRSQQQKLSDISPRRVDPRHDSFLARKEIWQAQIFGQATDEFFGLVGQPHLIVV